MNVKMKNKKKRAESERSADAQANMWLVCVKRRCCERKCFSCWVIEGLNGFEVDGQSKNDAFLQQSCQLSELICHVSVQMCVCMCEL